MSASFGRELKESDLITLFLDSPGQFLVRKLIQQMGQVPGFVNLFGAPVFGSAENGFRLEQAGKWADYGRQDWSIRQLPAIAIYEAEAEDKMGRNSYVNGTIQIQVCWPASFRRSDLSRIPAAFKGALMNFFESKLATSMLDEIYFHVRPEKVPGLNELGKVMNWSPNTEGLVENDFVPVTMVSVKYRLDLRSWYRYLEFDNRTIDQPFDRTLADLTQIGGEYDGVPKEDATQVQVVLPDKIPVSSN